LTRPRVRRAARTLGAGVALALLAAGAFPRGARAQAASAPEVELWSSTLSDAAAWMGAAGRAGYETAAGLGLGPPRALAGHARGGWRLFDPVRAPEGGPFPGLLAALPPLAAYDSLAVDPLSPPAASGPAGALVWVRPVADEGPGADRPNAIFAITNGDFGLDETSLTARRGGDLGRIHLESFAARRGPAGPFGESGRHRWSVGLGRRFGSHDFSATFRHAGLAARLRSGEEQVARGASGRLAWSRERPQDRFELAISRQWDAHESFGATLSPLARRDAQEVRVEGGAQRRSGSRRYGARVDWHRALVRRAGASPVATYGGDDWGSLFAADETPARSVQVELGGGRIGARDRYELAPAVRADWRSGRRRLELWGRRLLEPVWHDLAPGERNFLQRTWAVGAGASGGERAQGALRAMAGRTRDRALLARLPLEEQWLRAGIARDRDAWHFAQLWGEGRVRRGGWTAGGEASALLRDAGARQARLDPAWTARAYGQWEFATFGGDLGVRARLEADAIGERWSDEASPRRLAGFVTGHATLGFAIGDARVTLRVRNLENGTHEEVWIDGTTGLPAVAPPREFRMAIAWRLRN